MLRRDVLEQEAAGARLKGRVDVLVEVERRQDHDPRRATRRAVGGRPSEPARRLEPIEARHPDVHQDDVGRVAPRQADGGLAVRRLGDDLDVGLRLEDHAEPGPDQRLVVGDQDAKASGGHGISESGIGPDSSGSQARTA